MNPDNESKRNAPDDVAAVPVSKSSKSYAWLLALIPLALLGLLLSRCNRTETTTVAADVTPQPTATVAVSTTPAPIAVTPVIPVSTPPAAATPSPVGATSALVNPFTLITAGPDASKVVLNFDVNATTPNTDASTVLRGVVAYLQANPAARVSLKGFTDSTGTADVNRRLTEQRVQAVKTALTTAGVEAGRITSANFGEAHPVADNASPQAREMNRRVEIELAH